MGKHHWLILAGAFFAGWYLGNQQPQGQASTPLSILTSATGS